MISSRIKEIIRRKIITKPMKKKKKNNHSNQERKVRINNKLKTL